MRRLALLAIFVTGAWPLAAGEQVGRYEWSDVERIVAIGDVHGSDAKLVRLLAGVHLIDGSGDWVGGSTHLVLVGDMIDRGAGDRAVLDLLRDLQRQAPAAGGSVHVLVGNHEVMNLVRDLRYVNPDGYADFAAEETAKQRKGGFKRFRRRYDGSDVEAAFDAKYPPGYFARISAFDPEGEYGGWLLDQPILIKINDVLFVHGGLTERVAALGLDEINRQVMSILKQHLKVRDRLEARYIVDELMTFKEAQDAAQRFFDRNYKSLAARSWVAAVVDFGELPESELFGVEGPLWYRGNSLENERVERSRLERTLEALSARTLVVAHSPTGEKKITSRFGGRLYRIDHGMAYGARPLALVLEDRMALVFDPGVAELSEPQPELPQGESAWAHVGEFSDEQVIELLTYGEVVAMRELGRGSTRPKLVELRAGDMRMRAIFKTVDERPAREYRGQALDRHRQEVAAYRFDRLLDLGFVPVTVLRTLDGAEGSIQQWIEDAIDGETLADYPLVAKDPERMERQSALGLVFEYLIGNSSRSKSDLLYLLDESRVMCVDHSRAFPTAAIDLELPDEVDAGFLEALERIDASSLKTALGDLLTVGQIEAILRRRDHVLERYAEGSARSVAVEHGSALALQRLRPVRALTVHTRDSRVVVRAQVEKKEPSSPRTWTPEEKEHYLLNATVVSTKYIGEGVTKPKKITLELGGVTLSAAFKYHDEFRPGVTQLSEGPREVNFRDSYLFDRAAYLLDRELELGMVPPTVLRDVEGQAGALVWWVPDSISEVERMRRRILPGDPKILRRQQDVARLFYALVENTDENLNNQLLTIRDWRLHLIDLTRAFRFSKKLPREFNETPISLPRALYRRLQELEKDRLMTVMAGTLSKTQVRALLARRDAILVKIERDIEANGEEAVFQD
ncbi:MAG: metallophosphoesterase [Acidobacteriota bacterium]